MRSIDNNEGGFTLIEIITVILIFAIVSSIVMFNFRNFSSRVQFNNLAQDIALRIVQAQKNALNGLTNSNFNGVGMKPSYGVYFSTTASTTFIYFSDNDLDKYYTPSTCTGSPVLGAECISITGITTGEYVKQICYHTPLSGPSCTTDSLSIVFTRPNPDASIMIKPLSSSGASSVGPVCIGLGSKNDPTFSKTIMITNLGQVGVYSAPANSTSIAPVSACNI